MDPVTLSNITELDILQNSVNMSLCDNNDTGAVFGPLEVYRYDDILCIVIDNS